MADNSHDELLEGISKLGAAKIRILLEMAAALAAPLPHIHVARTTDIASDAFVESFGNRLRLHHSYIQEKFKKEQFESAFCAAIRDAGGNAKVVARRANPGEDVLVENVPCAMKTEAARTTRLDSIFISKYMEVNAIRQKFTKVDQSVDEIVRRFTKHLAHYDRIFNLKATDSPDHVGCVRYDLHEIPKDLFLLAGNGACQQRPSGFTAAGGFTVKIHQNNDYKFDLILDGSDEKIRVGNIKISDCMHHATWVVPVTASG